jgi:hypothetical protein
MPEPDDFGLHVDVDLAGTAAVERDRDHPFVVEGQDAPRLKTDGFTLTRTVEQGYECAILLTSAKRLDVRADHGIPR